MKKGRRDRSFAQFFNRARAERNLQDGDNSVDVYEEISEPLLPLAHVVRDPFWREVRECAVFAIPIVVSSFLEYGVSMTTVFLVGHLGMNELGAASLGNLFVNVTGIAPLTGMACAVDILASQAVGAKNYRRIGSISQRGLAILSLLSFPVAAIWWFSHIVLELLGQDEDIVLLAARYCRVYMIAIPPLVVFEILKRHLQSIGVVRAIMVISGVGFVLNGALGVFLVYGLKWGFLGAPWALVMTRWLMVAGLISFHLWHRSVFFMGHSLDSGQLLAFQKQPVTGREYGSVDGSKEVVHNTLVPSTAVTRREDKSVSQSQNQERNFWAVRSGNQEKAWEENNNKVEAKEIKQPVKAVAQPAREGEPEPPGHGQVGQEGPEGKEPEGEPESSPRSYEQLANPFEDAERRQGEPFSMNTDDIWEIQPGETVGGEDDDTDEAVALAIRDLEDSLDEEQPSAQQQPQDHHQQQQLQQPLLQQEGEGEGVVQKPGGIVQKSVGSAQQYPLLHPQQSIAQQSGQSAHLPQGEQMQVQGEDNNSVKGQGRKKEENRGNELQDYCLRQPGDSASMCSFDMLNVDDILDRTWEENWTCSVAFSGWGDFLKLGFPSFLMLLIEWGSFEMQALIAGTHSVLTLDAHTVFATTVSLSFTCIIGMSVTASIRVGQSIGDRKVGNARRTYRAVMTLAIVFLLMNSGIVLLVHAVWGQAFSNDPEVIDLVSKFVFLCALFTIPDAMQGISSGVLRGLGYPSIGVICNVLGYLCVGIPLSWTLCVTQGHGLPGLWVGSVIGSITSAVLLALSLCVVNWQKAAEEAHRLAMSYPCITSDVSSDADDMVVVTQEAKGNITDLTRQSLQADVLRKAPKGSRSFLDPAEPSLPWGI